FTGFRIASQWVVRALGTVENETDFVLNDTVAGHGDDNRIRDLATGWKYQQTVCVPQGMGVTFFGIGPIGATILAVELLKLPLAIWTASRHGWQKGFMLIVGLPLICLLTFQLVKDMAVYEMGTAMAPASQFLEKATAEETKIAQLNGELAA